MRIDRQRHRPLEVSIGPADRDPMFKPVWYSENDTLTPPTPPELEPVTVEERRRKGLPDYPKPPLGPSPQWDLAPLPPPDTQQNDHVMRYWNWRLDRMGAKRDG